MSTGGAGLHRRGCRLGLADASVAMIAETAADMIREGVKTGVAAAAA